MSTIAKDRRAVARSGEITPGVISRPDFASGPAYEIIAATSVVEHMRWLTRDRRILRSKTVPLAQAGGRA